MCDPIIEISNIEKIYRLGRSQNKFNTLSGSVSDFLLLPFSNILEIKRLTHFSNKDQSNFDQSILYALKDVSFNIARGDVVGIVGRNGAGKSTLLKILARITEPSSGKALIRGRIASLLEVGTGFHPELSGRENIFLNGAILGMRKTEIRQKFDEIVEFAELNTFIDTPVKRYSSGMYVRLAFSVAANLDAEILLIDEVLAVGDIAFQRKCLQKMGEVVTDRGRTILFVSHNIGAILELCNRAVLISHGRLIEDGMPEVVVKKYQDSLSESNFSNNFNIVKFINLSLKTENEEFIVYNNSPFNISGSIEIPKNSSGYALYCIIENSLGHMITHTRVDVSKNKMGNYNDSITKVSFEYPALFLNPGVYLFYWKVIILSVDVGHGRYLSDKISFSVLGNCNIPEVTLNPIVKTNFL